MQRLRAYLLTVAGPVRSPHHNVQLAALLGGSVLVEQIFSIPGMGSYMLAAITGRDVPVIQAVVLVFVVVQMGVSLLTDLSYGWLNPKIRLGGA